MLASASITQSHDSNASTPSGILYVISSTLAYDRISTCYRASITQSHDSSASTPSGILYLISSTLAYDRISTCYRAFAISLSVSKEPDSYVEAILDPRWQEAMQAEINALKANKT